MKNPDRAGFASFINAMRIRLEVSESLAADAVDFVTMLSDTLEEVGIAARRLRRASEQPQSA